MGRHNIPGPDDTPREPFPARPPPEQPGRTPYPAYVPLEGEQASETRTVPHGQRALRRPLRRRLMAGRSSEHGNETPRHEYRRDRRPGGHRGLCQRGHPVAVLRWSAVGPFRTAAATCSGSAVPVAVVAEPSIADKIEGLANRYNKSAGPIGDRCVKLGVKPADSGDVINGFVGNWPSEVGERPALWIPASSVSTSRLQAAAGSKIITDSRSLVSSPVLLAIKPQLKPASGGAELGHATGASDQPGGAGREEHAGLGVVAAGVADG